MARFDAECNLVRNPPRPKRGARGKSLSRAHVVTATRAAQSRKRAAITGKSVAHDPTKTRPPGRADKVPFDFTLPDQSRSLRGADRASSQFFAVLPLDVAALPPKKVAM